ncbi:MAG: nucleotidyltransferase domain-containing protein [Nitrospirae bacterium]|nr:nucleotidyltransferase domain-containing protein [Nitrospirota bacterium]MBA3071266.1 nucleotidyltransferase domain-containing protein [Nitrospirota bacterium]
MEKKIKKQLKDSGVSIVYLFGSMSSGRTSPMSDVDIGIVLKAIQGLTLFLVVCPACMD